MITEEKPIQEERLCNPHDLIFIQSRAEMDFALVDEYKEMMEAGIVFDAVEGIENGEGKIHIYDGFHRGEAAKAAGVMLLVNVQPGTKEEAEWRAFNANIKHGLRRTRKDIERIVKNALRHPRGVSLSNREIARHCGCDDKTVGKYRKELEASAEIPQIETRDIKRGEQSYQMEIPSKPEPQPKTEPQQPEPEPIPDERQIDIEETISQAEEAEQQEAEPEESEPDESELAPPIPHMDMIGKHYKTPYGTGRVNGIMKDGSFMVEFNNAKVGGYEIRNLQPGELIEETSRGLLCEICGKLLPTGKRMLELMDEATQKFLCEDCKAAATEPPPSEFEKAINEYWAINGIKWETLSDQDLHEMIKLAKRELTRRHRPQMEGDQDLLTHHKIHAPKFEDMNKQIEATERLIAAEEEEAEEAEPATTTIRKAADVSEAECDACPMAEAEHPLTEGTSGDLLCIKNQDPLRFRVVQLKKEGLSVRKIATQLEQEGFKTSKSAVDRIIRKAQEEGLL